MNAGELDMGHIEHYVWPCVNADFTGYANPRALQPPNMVRLARVKRFIYTYTAAMFGMIGVNSTG